MLSLKCTNGDGLAAARRTETLPMLVVMCLCSDSNSQVCEVRQCPILGDKGEIKDFSQNVSVQN